MMKKFSHLVWLGAGAIAEPAGLLNCAEHAILVEAREIACLSLRQKYQHRGVIVKQLLLAVDNTNTEFTEYNLSEYSAIQPVTGLKVLFPGLKATSSTQLYATRVDDFINELGLSDHNNLLIVDIPDNNLALLTILQQQKQLTQFSEIYMQAGSIPLYKEASTTIEITNFLQQHGYLLEQTIDDDPDLPWLKFRLNPLWQKFQHTQQINNELNIELEKVKQQRDQAHSNIFTLQQHVNDFDDLKIKVSHLESKLEAEIQQHTSTTQEKSKLIYELQNQTESARKNAAARLEKITLLEKNNQKLDIINIQLTKQQSAIQQEILKAQAQMAVIKDLFLSRQ